MCGGGGKVSKNLNSDDTMQKFVGKWECVDGSDAIAIKFANNSNFTMEEFNMKNPTGYYYGIFMFAPSTQILALFTSNTLTNVMYRINNLQPDSFFATNMYTGRSGIFNRRK